MNADSIDNNYFKKLIINYPLTSFIVMAYGITWLSLVPLLATGIEAAEIPVMFGLFGPALAAYFVTRAGSSEKKSPGDMRFWRVFLAVWVIGTLVYSFLSRLNSPLPITTALAILCLPSFILAWMVANGWNRRPSIRALFKNLTTFKGPGWIFVFCLLYFPLSHYAFTFISGSEYNLWPKDQTGLAYGGLWLLVFMKILFFTGGVNEEPGWRGFFLKGLLEKYNPLSATLIVWIFWAVWHFPFELGPISNMTIYQVAEKWLWMLAPTALFTWAFVRTGGSLLVCVLLHASMNATSEFIPITTGAKILTAAVAIALFAELKYRSNRTA